MPYNMTMEINTKTVFALLLVSLMSGYISGCYIVLDDGDHDSYDSYDSYDTHYDSVPWLDISSTYWYCEDNGPTGYWELYTIASDSDGYDDIWSVGYNVYNYNGYIVLWGNLYSDYALNTNSEEYFRAFTEYDNYCNDVYEVEFYVEDWDGNYTSLWIY